MKRSGLKRENDWFHRNGVAYRSCDSCVAMNDYLF